MEHPDTMLFGERTCTAHRAQGYLLAETIHFEGVTGLQMQFLP
jgi:hypothetical protein